MSQQLDRGKPLWEVWYVEGLEGDRFAMIVKIHHCLADGVSGAELLTVIMPTRRDEESAEPGPWLPRPQPSAGRLLFDETARRMLAPLSAAQSGGKILKHPGEALEDVERVARGVQEALSTGMTPASETPFNADLGPHRRFDWTRFDLDAAKEVKNVLGGKLNDVVLAVVAGGVRRFLEGRGLHVDDLVFRAVVPVNIRTADQEGTLGNRVSQMLTELPVDEGDPLRRYGRVLETTEGLKQSDQSYGTGALIEMADHLLPGALGTLTRLALHGRAANLVVTNVPGPPTQVHLLGAPMLDVYPVVPLAPCQTLGIAQFSYAGGLYWGFNADWDVMPDLHDLVEAVEQEFEVLREAAAQSAASTGDRNRA
jgi:WS/DGAT/MGAT family acyltransferase